MNDARDLILRALATAPEITGGGATSMMAIAARALDAEVTLSRKGIARTLGLHSSCVVAGLVAADLAGDTETRRELGRALFESLPLGTHPLGLTALGELTVALTCLDRLTPLDHLFDGLVGRVAITTRAAVDGEVPEPLVLKELEEAAQGYQQAKVVVMEKGAKSKLGVPPHEVIRRRGAQALRALIAGLHEDAPNPHLSSTVAGEVAAVVSTSFGTEAAATFCIELGETLSTLPPSHAAPKRGNGH